jgi:hypothetical protein
MGYLWTDQPDGERFEIITFNAGRIGVIVLPAGGASGAVAVARHYFVDATHGSDVTGNGTLSHPYATIQAAITAVELTTLTNAVIQIAPGDYIAGHVVAASVTLVNLTFSGWNTTETAFIGGQPTIGGLVVIEPGVSVHFCNVELAANLRPPNDTRDGLLATFDGCNVSGPVTAGTLVILATRTRFFQTLRGDIATNIALDGFTWAALVAAAVVILPADYTRQFLDTGADVATDTLVANGVPVLTAVDIYTDHPRTRPGEFAICTLTSPDTAADFTVTFAYTVDDAVHWTLFNISRNPGDFSEAMKSVVFHGAMAEPAPT